MTDQADRWGSEFGEDYTGRNPTTPEDMEALYAARFHMTRTSMNEEFLCGVPRDARVLEVGCNVGMQLHLLARMGFENLFGVEINSLAVERARRLNTGLPIDVVKGSALELPFPDDSFDLVYTSGVLIHIHPDDLPSVQREMVRCTRRWVWGFEYHAPSGHVEIPYRGERNLLWKADFAHTFVERFPELRLVNKRLYTYSDEPGGLQDAMYLLERR